MNINANQASSASQNAQIQKWLEQGHTITALEALEMFGCMRLPSRIHDLKKRGVPIKSDTVVTSTGKRVSQYRIAP